MIGRSLARHPEVRVQRASKEGADWAADRAQR
jgi:hypothetical protein